MEKKFGLAKVECASCHCLYFIRDDWQDVRIPEGVFAGEAFPCECPLCEGEAGRYAIFLSYWD